MSFQPQFNSIQFNSQVNSMPPWLELRPSGEISSGCEGGSARVLKGQSAGSSTASRTAMNPQLVTTTKEWSSPQPSRRLP